MAFRVAIAGPAKAAVAPAIQTARSFSTVATGVSASSASELSGLPRNLSSPANFVPSAPHVALGRQSPLAALFQTLPMILPSLPRNPFPVSIPPALEMPTIPIPLIDIRPPAVEAPTLECVKTTYTPNKRKKKTTHGFLRRLKTVGGRNVLRRRLRKGRHRMAV